MSRPFLARWFKWILSSRWLRRAAPARRAGANARPRLEALEDRNVLSLYPTELALSNLAGYTGFALKSEDRFGNGDVHAEGMAGDVNGDGFDDALVIDTYLRRAYVVFGRDTRFPAVLDLASLDGRNGFALDGPAVDGLSNGFTAAAAGDVNGDGLDDVIVGASGDFDSPGHAYVVFGKRTGFSPRLNLSKLNGRNGFTLDGLTVDDSRAITVAGAGDINGDGLDDMILGAPYAFRNGYYSSGKAYVVLGRSSFADSPVIDLTSLDGSNGFTLNAASEKDRIGWAVDGAGDVNDDGIDDAIVSGLFAGPSGQEAYVVFGQRTPFGASLDLGSLDGSNGFALISVSGKSRLASASRAGDVNGDGKDDLIVGASYSRSDEAFVVFGQSTPFEASLDLDSLDGSNGFTLNGTVRTDDSGRSVGCADAGDVNGDGFDDVTVSGSKDYVVFGRGGPFAANFDLSSLDGSNGFLGARGAGGRASDFNGDGADDMIGGGGLKAYVIFGRRPGAPAATLTSAPDVTASGGTTYEFTITYTDDEGIVFSTIDSHDAVVTGPCGFRREATLVSAAPAGNGTPRTATYRLTPPAGFWDFRDDGVYTISMADGQVRDVSGRFVPPDPLGTFEVDTPAQLIAVGSNAGAPGLVQVFLPGHKLLYQFQPYSNSFAGGVRVAVGDINADGVPDIVTAPGPGILTEIKAFDGYTGRQLVLVNRDRFGNVNFIRKLQYQPYGNFTGGAYVAVADVSGLRGSEIIVGAGKNADINQVRVFSFNLDDTRGHIIGIGGLVDPVPYGPGYKGGVRVAAGDLDGDHFPDIVTARTQGSSSVLVHNSDDSVQFAPIAAFAKPGGNFVAVGDVNGDGFNEIVVAREGGNGTSLKVIDFANNTTETIRTGFPIARVGLLDVNGDHRLDILATTAKGRRVEVFDYLSKELIDTIFAFDKAFNGGLYVAGG